MTEGVGVPPGAGTQSETLPNAAQMDWQVELQIRPPQPMYDPAHPLFEQIKGMLEGRDPVLTLGSDAIKLVFLTAGNSPAEAFTGTHTIICQLDGLLKPNGHEMIELNLEEKDYAGHKLLGFNEVTRILGVSKQRVYQLAQAGKLPPPVFRLKATPIWRSADIRQFKRSRNKSKQS